MSLNGKVVILSGGSRGIGRAIVIALAKKGAKVAFTYFQSPDPTEKIMEEIKDMTGCIKGYKVDIRNQQQIKDMVFKVVQEWETIDIIINNAGIRKDKTLAFMSSDDWNDVIQTNITGTFYFTQAGIFHLLKKKRGRVINISSISGISGIAGQTNYSSSKAAIIGFTRSLAKEVAPYGISVNAVAPGGVDTEMTRSLRKNEMEKLLIGVPLGRMCISEEVAQVVSFLADSELCPDYLTGNVIPLDGGCGS